MRCWRAWRGGEFSTILGDRWKSSIPGAFFRKSICMIQGQFPKREWRPNADGRPRNVQEAMQIATRWGVTIPDDVEFHPDRYGYIDDSNTFARSPKITKRIDARVYWSDLVHGLTGKVPFLVRESVFSSDEAIVAVFAHEIHELEYLRPLLQTRGIPMLDFNGHTCAGNPGNIHDEAWDVADRLVDQMRGLIK
jgi:hypothetical protein